MRTNLIQLACVGLLTAVAAEGFAGDPPRAVQTAALQKCAALAEAEIGPSAACFAAFAEAHPTSEYADLALFNAAVGFETTGADTAAVDAAKRLVQGYPQSQHVPGALLVWADTLEGRGEIEEAVRVRLQLVDRFPQSDDARDVMQAVVAWYAVTGDPKRLDAAADKYARNWPRDSEAAWVAATPILARERGCKVVRKRAPGWLKRWSWSDRSSDKVALRLGRCLAAGGDAKAAHKIFSKVVAAEGDGVLEARFRLAELQRSKPRPAPKAGDEAGGKEWVRLRIADASEDAKRYQSVMGHGGNAGDDGGLRWRLAAAVRLGQVYDDFAEELGALPVPQALAKDPAAAAVYQQAVDDQARPMRQKALETYVSVVTRAGAVAVYDEHIKIARARLAVLDPGAWPAPTGTPKLDAAEQPVGTDKEGTKPRYVPQRALARRALADGHPERVIYLLQGLRDDADALNLYAVAAWRRDSPEVALHLLSVATRLDPTHAAAAANLRAVRTALGLPSGAQ